MVMVELRGLRGGALDNGGFVRHGGGVVQFVFTKFITFTI